MRNNYQKRKQDSWKNIEKIKYDEYTNEKATYTAIKLRECREAKKYSRGKIDDLSQNGEFPAGYNSLLRYEQFVYEKTKGQTVKGMRLATFYELCRFYDVSADYLLGFKISKHAENTADYIMKEWKFSDDFLFKIKEMQARKSPIDKQYKQTNVFEFAEYFIMNCMQKFEYAVMDYISSLAEMERFKTENIKYIDSETGRLKIIDADEDLNVNERNLLNSHNSSLETEYETLYARLKATRYDIMRCIDGFVDDVVDEWKNKS